MNSYRYYLTGVLVGDPSASSSERSAVKNTDRRGEGGTSAISEHIIAEYSKSQGVLSRDDQIVNRTPVRVILPRVEISYWFRRGTQTAGVMRFSGSQVHAADIPEGHSQRFVMNLMRLIAPTV